MDTQKIKQGEHQIKEILNSMIDELRKEVTGGYLSICVEADSHFDYSRLMVYKTEHKAQMFFGSKIGEGDFLGEGNLAEQAKKLIKKVNENTQSDSAKDSEAF